MKGLTHHSRSRLLIWIAGALIFAITPAARAAEAPEAGKAQPVAAASEAETDATASIAYAAFANALKSAPVEAAPVEIVPSFSLPAISPPASAPAKAPAQTQERRPRFSLVPMTPGEKFMEFISGSFKPPAPYAMSAFTGMFNELLDNDEGKEDTIGNYFADSATRATRSFANRIANNFFQDFVFASLFKQDPRYFRSGKRTIGGKIGYAISRLFITRSDKGTEQINVSYLLGGLVGTAVSTTWQREEQQNWKDGFRRWGISLALRAGTNIVREFASGH